MLHLFVDADACPVKDEVYRVARRHGLASPWSPTRAARAGRPAGHRPGGAPAASTRPTTGSPAGSRPSDIVITADIPLAARCLEAGAEVLGPTGKPFTEANIGDVLATRDLLAGPARRRRNHRRTAARSTARDRSRFLQSLDELVNAIRRRNDG